MEAKKVLWVDDPWRREYVKDNLERVAGVSFVFITQIDELNAALKGDIVADDVIIVVNTQIELGERYYDGGDIAEKFWIKGGRKITCVSSDAASKLSTNIEIPYIFIHFPSKDKGYLEEVKQVIEKLLTLKYNDEFTWTQDVSKAFS
jgi:hypothetical protein